MELFDELAARRSADASLETERAIACERVSEVRREQGQLDASLAAARKAVAIIEAMPGNTMTPDTREALALAYIALGDVLGNPFVNNLGNPATALEHFRRALGIREELQTADPQNLERATATGVAHSRVATILWAQKDGAGALQHYEEELAIEDHVLAANPNNNVSQRAVAITLSQIVSIVFQTGDLARARDCLARSIGLFEQAANADPQNATAKKDLGIAYSRMVAVTGKSGDAAGAREYFDKALELYSTLLARDPNNQNLILMMRAHYARMSDAMLDLNRPDDALSFSTKGVEAADRAIALASRPDTRRFKAHSLIDRGKIYVLLAQDSRTPAAEQPQHWSAACADYKEALRLLDTIPKEAILPIDKTKRDEATTGIAQCEHVASAPKQP